jgi:hypothetical protein
MNKVPTWFYVVAVIALLWNAAGLMAVIADLRLSAADIATLPADQQALYAARPGWSVVGSVIAVCAGTLGCLLLLLRKRLAIVLFGLSLAGIVLQNIGIFVIAGAGKNGDPVPFVLQGIVFLIAIGLLLLARRAKANGWLT